MVYWRGEGAGMPDTLDHVGSMGVAGWLGCDGVITTIGGCGCADGRSRAARCEPNYMPPRMANGTTSPAPHAAPVSIVIV